MSGIPAARLGDLGLCSKRKKTAPAIEGSNNVLINGRPAVRQGDAYAAPVGGVLASGSPTVFINGRPAGRIGDTITGGWVDTTGSPNVFIGSSSPPGSRKPFREKCEKCTPVDVPVPADKSKETPVEKSKKNKQTCDLITAEMLKIVWPKGSDENLQAIAEELNYSINIGLIDTKERLAHFLGQTAIEAGAGLRLRENLNFTTAKILADTFSGFSSTGKRKGPPNQKAHDIFKIKNMQEREAAIAKVAYENNKNLGNTEKGDGYKFIGRGIKQLTGRWNYTNFQKNYPSLWGEEDVDFVENPELLEQPKYAVRSALYFWHSKKLWKLADEGVTEAVANKISEIINKYDGDSFTRRWEEVDRIYKNNKFNNICYNTEKKLSNLKAKNPYNNDRKKRKGEKQ